MGLLDAPGDILNAVTDLVADLFDGPVEYQGSDFKDGFAITEFIDGIEQVAGRIVLKGTMMPKQPFVWGGKQHLNKEFYPGNPEPTVQVMGSRENDIVIKGRLKAKNFPRNSPAGDMRKVPGIIQEQLDTMRQRGNLCSFVMGEWVRYGFIEESSFTMKTLADMEYEISIFVIGDKPPSLCKISDESSLELPSALNAALVNAALSAEAKMLAPPEGMSLGLFGELNKLVGNVATAIALVTNFVNTIVTAAEDAQKLANKAIGLIKYAQAQTFLFKFKVSQLDAYLGTDPVGSAETLANEASAAAQAKFVFDVGSSTMLPAVNVTPEMLASAKTASTKTYVASDEEEAAFATAQTGNSVESLLSALLKSFQKLAQTFPIARHLVTEEDSLTSLSIKYYNTSEQWERIKKHNKLTDIVLVPGTVLEIPKL